MINLQNQNPLVINTLTEIVNRNKNEYQNNINKGHMQCTPDVIVGSPHMLRVRIKQS